MQSGPIQNFAMMGDVCPPQTPISPSLTFLSPFLLGGLFLIQKGAAGSAVSFFIVSRHSPAAKSIFLHFQLKRAQITVKHTTDTSTL